MRIRLEKEDTLCVENPTTCSFVLASFVLKSAFFKPSSPACVWSQLPCRHTRSVVVRKSIFRTSILAANRGVYVRVWVWVCVDVLCACVGCQCECVNKHVGVWVLGSASLLGALSAQGMMNLLTMEKKSFYLWFLFWQYKMMYGSKVNTWLASRWVDR